MIAGLIRWSIKNRFLVLVLTVLVTAGGIYSLRQTPVDALPDLSDVQVIIPEAGTKATNAADGNCAEVNRMAAWQATGSFTIDGTLASAVMAPWAKRITPTSPGPSAGSKAALRWSSARKTTPTGRDRRSTAGAANDG